MEPRINTRSPKILSQLVSRAGRSPVNRDAIYFYQRALNGGVHLEGNEHGALAILLEELNEIKLAIKHYKIAINK